MSRLIIIDGYSLLFRSYYATAYPGVEIMRTKDGTPTNAIFAFSNMINKIVANLKDGDAIAVAFDAGKPTFRHEALETYKANRKPAPEDLVPQFPIAREFINAMGIYQFEKEGVEGDDIAGTIAKRGEEKGYEVYLYTSDRDFIQLVDDKISINIIRKGLSDVMVMTPELVKEEYGFEPLQIIDYKGLRGDSSDNLPGIPGVGEKTAVKLITEYQNFDNIINHADEIGGRIGNSLKENQELGRLCRDLAIIKTDIELPFDIDDTIYNGYSFDKISEFAKKYEFKQFMSKISPKWKRKDELPADLNIEFLTSLNDIAIPEELSLALDYEGEDYSRDDVFGIALNINGRHIYIDIENAKKDDKLKAILEDKNIKKYCYDFKAIKVALSRYGIEIDGCVFDLLIATYLLDPSPVSDVDKVMNQYHLDLPVKENVSLLATANPQRPVRIALYSRLLYENVKRELQKVDILELFNTLELPLASTLADMEIEGFPVDINILNELGDNYRKKMQENEEIVYQLTGEKFNINSPKQIADILYNKLKLPNNKKGSTSIEALKELIDLHPAIIYLIEYRKYFKLVSTYIDGIKPHIFSDNKIHAKFNQALTSTGRLSSSEPNLQNISVRDEEGKLIRKAFKYPSDEYEILSLDYSQIELRILASLSNCKGLQEIFASGEDIHSATAKKVFHIEGEPTTTQRRRAKAVNFGIIYGISDWGLAEQIDSSVSEAKQIISEFYSSFPEVMDFFKNVVDNASKDGYVSTVMGRRRYLNELHDSNYATREFAKRAAMNAPIQGSAADLIKIAMIKVDNLLKEKGLKTKMVCQIHDELIFKVPKDEKEIAYNLIKETMEHAMQLSVNLEVDGGFGKDWYDAK